MATSSAGRDIFDIVVIGGGAAGLSGAKITARSRRSVLVIDSGAPRKRTRRGRSQLSVRRGHVTCEAG